MTVPLNSSRPLTSTGPRIKEEAQRLSNTLIISMPYFRSIMFSKTSKTTGKIQLSLKGEITDKEDIAAMRLSH